MIGEIYYEIPRIFTAIAESLACLIYILSMKKRHDSAEQIFYMTAGPVALILIHMVNDELPVVFWIPGMLIAMLTMFLYIKSTCDVNNKDAMYLFVRAFILAEFVAAFEWQIYFYMIYTGLRHTWVLATLTMVVLYTPLFLFAYFLDARKMARDSHMGVSMKEVINAVIIGLTTFSINNVNFVWDTPFVSRQIGANILYIRTLVDFCGVLILFAWSEQRREMNLNHELNTINDILRRRYDQYQESKESIDMINRKYHDLKHQIATIRNEKDPEKREEYLEEIDHAMAIYSAQFDTGNPVVDTLLTGKSLYCHENHINLSCVVDGEAVNFMKVMDICSIFGNALDNCIESVSKLEDLDKRIIRVAVFTKNQFVMMRFENYYEAHLEFDRGVPVTTKSDTYYHGYGIKSIKKTIEKYNGNLSIDAGNHWFDMKILVPLPESKE